MSVIPERFNDEPEDLPPDDERNDERRACTREEIEEREPWRNSSPREARGAAVGTGRALLDGLDSPGPGS